MSITPISLVSSITSLTPPHAAPAGNSFENVLGQALQGLNSSQNLADQQATNLATGQNVNLVDTVLTMQETSIDFKMAMQVRNKVIDAYQEIMRTQV